jgi:hypothetical protein
MSMNLDIDTCVKNTKFSSKTNLPLEKLPLAFCRI